VLETLCNEAPGTVATVNGIYTHGMIVPLHTITCFTFEIERPVQKLVTICVLQMQSQNWGLHVDGRWKASVYLTDYLPRPFAGKHVLELGAAAGSS
jgi:hypothetical protein